VVNFLKSVQTEWKANPAICGSMLSSADAKAVAKRYKRIAGLAPKTAPDATEIAEFWFGPAGIFFENLMLKSQ
jgi:hypothetical protein